MLPRKASSSLQILSLLSLTGHPDLESAMEGIHLGVLDYITKPTNTDELVALLAAKLAARELAKTWNGRSAAGLKAKTKRDTSSDGRWRENFRSESRRLAGLRGVKRQKFILKRTKINHEELEELLGDA
jgi:DNA-binding response OmpR family regulator